MPPVTQVLSFRHLVTEAVGQFIAAEGMGGQELAEALTEVLVSLSRYREEGAVLFPQVFLAERLESLLAAVGGSAVRIGSGGRSPETVRRVLKDCAPLAQGGWCIFISLNTTPNGARFDYGVFHTNPAPLAREPMELLADAVNPGLHVVGVRQLAENVVELRGGSGATRYVYLSAARTDAPLPSKVIEELSQAVAHDTPPAAAPGVARFYRHLLRRVMQSPHGSLVAVLPREREWIDLFADGISLSQPVDVAAAVARHDAERDVPAHAELAALVPLMHGMMAVDGITVLRTDGALVGYHVFILPEPGAPEGLLGGARRRTFRALCARVGTDLAAAFYCSQDGAADCRVGAQYRRTRSA